MTDDVIALRSGDLEAAVSPLGAELVELRHRGRDLLWSGDARFWASRSPILFPVVGRVRDGVIRVDGRTFPMPQHGFARASVFEIRERTSSGCLMSLRDSSATRTHYPYPFNLDLAYAIEGAALRVEATVSNPGADVLPASFGFHPGFRWPLEPGLNKADYAIRFQAGETTTVARLDADGLIAAQSEQLQHDGNLPLGEALFARGAVIMLSALSREVVFGPRRGGLALRVTFDGLPQLALWMRPGAEYLCIEPWRGFADPEDFRGAFADKPGLVHLAPGDSARFRLDVEPFNAAPTTSTGDVLPPALC